MNPRLSADAVRAQIQRLLVDCPELREDDEALVMSLESETDATELCTRLVKASKEAQAQAAGIASYMTELGVRVNMLDRRDERLRELLLQIMESAGVTKLPLPIATLSVSHRRHVVITERDLIPEYYRRQPPWEPDKKLIGARIKAGEAVPGCKLSNAEPSLTIRIK